MNTVSTNDIKLLHQLFVNSADGLFITDANFRVTEMDEAFRKTLRLKHQELLFALSDLFVDESAFTTVVETLKSKKRVQKLEVLWRVGKQKTRYCELNILSSTTEGGKPFYMGFIFNISDRKTAERELVQAEKLLAAGKLSRILAHEIRNPLTNIQLALEQLKDEFEVHKDEAAIYFDVLQRNTDRVGNLITALLNSSRPKTLQRLPQNTNDIVNKALDLVKDRLTLQEIELKTQLAKTALQASVDSEQLMLALVNILVNGIEAMQAGKGELKVQTRAKNGFVEIEIADNGCGMTNEEAEMLFEPFYTKKQGGTGLGLTTVQNIIQSHEGKIAVYSKLKRGSRFTIKLPKV